MRNTTEYVGYYKDGTNTIYGALFVPDGVAHGWVLNKDNIKKKQSNQTGSIPSNQLKTSLAALRKDKPVLLYENQRAQRVTNAALFLKKQGFSEIYILSYGLDSWTGKVKSN